ncbi:ABC transporter permease [Winogradskyella immobilis]|uniref:ABC transporter permease n=1 Tax=Winogradskyella immobilis TaxID=2816852 RepID=A0ABS8EMK8_9FLAO|nr:ABC transporter permease [Winogradskyella immobilis]MCC1484449.1 ABC transporter permease [Winogradskyella immobilis]MCG0016541.1 ABC transporter permease [Winogradskyella immobilis]
MIKYILHKVFYAFLTLIGVVTVIFFLFTILPGDPAKMMLGQNQTAEQVDAVKKKYGFDKPISTQYAYYINDLSPISFHSILENDYTFLSENKYKVSKLFTVGKTTIVIKLPYLRESFTKQGKKVSQVIKETLPNTFVLAVSAILIAIVLGVIFGIVSALYKDKWIDKSIQILSTLGMSVPSFFSAILFAWLFGFVLHKYTNLEMTGSLYELDDFGEKVNVKWKNLILPAIVLGIRPLAVVIQLMRNSLLEVMNQDYIRTARAKGLSEFQVIKNHAVKNALNPVITAISGWFASMLAGAVFVEYIFGWNGLGKEIVNALNTLDLPVIMGSVLIIATSFIIINIGVDLIYAWLDPRVKLD